MLLGLRMGALLPRMRLDESPQVFNDFRGETSPVGPRPSFTYELETGRRGSDLKNSLKTIPTLINERAPDNICLSRL